MESRIDALSKALPPLLTRGSFSWNVCLGPCLKRKKHKAKKNIAAQISSGFAAFSLFGALAFASSDDCRAWFERQGIKKGEDCPIECSIAETDMGTFHCSEQCADLCKKEPKEGLYLALSKVYPTLTQAERDLTAKHPKKMLTAYKINWESENLCLTLFEESRTNDDSDACRHFVGAALLYKKFGRKLSKKILDAHEENPKQPSKEKLMDIENNHLGLTAAAHLKKKNKLNKKEILKSFQKNLKKGTLVILKPGAEKASQKSAIEKIWNKLKRQKKYKKSKQKEEK